MKKTIIKVCSLILTLLIFTSCVSKNPYKQIKALKLDKNNFVLEKDQTEKLNIATEPVNKPISELIWSSGDEKVAEVDSEGLVKAVGIGNYTITAKTPDGKFSITSNITVNPKSVKELKIDKDTVSLEVGSAEQLKAIIAQLDAKAPEMQWNSSDPKIVSVDGNGLIKAI